MSIIQSLLWVVLPYSSLAICVMGFIWQYEDKEDYKYILRFKKGFGLILTILVIGTGVVSLYTVGTEVSVLSWIKSLLQLNPNISMLEAAPMITKIHLISSCILMLFLPTTRYIKLPNIFLNKRYLAIPLFFLLLGV